MASPATPSLIPGEHLIISSGNGVLILTTLRVLYDLKTTGASKFISIPLDAVASCSLAMRSQPLLLVFAVIAAIAAFSRQLELSAVIGAGIIAIFFVAAYFVTRRAKLTISPNGGEEISVATQGMKREDILSFLNAVIQARNNYLQRGRTGEA